MVPRRAVIFLAVAWILVVLYPDPGVLLRSIGNAAHPRIEPEAVAGLARRLPDDPRAIEAYVLDRQVPYSYDWQSAGVPWYFPSTTEALRSGNGDCESRALVLASILTAKGIPNELRLSFDHIWVDYPGKQANAMENAGVQFAGTQDGRFFIHWPKDFRLGQEIQDQLSIYWEPAPAWRVLLLLAGISLIALWNTLAWRIGAGRLAADGLLPAWEPRRRRLHGRSVRAQWRLARGGTLTRPQRACPTRPRRARIPV